MDFQPSCRRWGKWLTPTAATRVCGVPQIREENVCHPVSHETNRTAATLTLTVRQSDLPSQPLGNTPVPVAPGCRTLRQPFPRTGVASSSINNQSPTANHNRELANSRSQSTAEPSEKKTKARILYTGGEEGRHLFSVRGVRNGYMQRSGSTLRQQASLCLYVTVWEYLETAGMFLPGT